MTLNDFVWHTLDRIEYFFKYLYQGVRFFGGNCWFHTCGPLIANLHTLLKTSGPKKHPFQHTKNEIVYRVQELIP